MELKNEKEEYKNAKKRELKNAYNQHMTGKIELR